MDDGRKKNASPWGGREAIAVDALIVLAA